MGKSGTQRLHGWKQLRFCRCRCLPKGLKGYDIETLWEAVKHGANAVHPNVRSTGRLGHEYYNKLGYVPYNVGINENAARTLEYAYDDWCIYQLGKALKKPKKRLKSLQSVQ